MIDKINRIKQFLFEAEKDYHKGLILTRDLWQILEGENKMELKFKRLNELATIPEYKTSGSAGMDIRSIEEVMIEPMQIKLIKTGLSVEIPVGYEVQVRARSGLSTKHGLTLINAVGTIDSDYRGEIGVPLINLGDESYTIKTGERIAQLVVNKIEQPRIILTDELTETERGQGGFGSTGAV